jgi:hypothetical protein
LTALASIKLLAMVALFDLSLLLIAGFAAALAVIIM